jgi:hypothetical protein
MLLAMRKEGLKSSEDATIRNYQQKVLVEEFLIRACPNCWLSATFETCIGYLEVLSLKRGDFAVVLRFVAGSEISCSFGHIELYQCFLT